MPKLSRNKLDQNTHQKILNQLITTLGRLTKEADVEDLFESLFTKTEKIMLAKRLAIAVLLERGASYIEISKSLKVSSVTISFVRNSMLKNNNSYQRLIEVLNKNF